MRYSHCLSLLIILPFKAISAMHELGRANQSLQMDMNKMTGRKWLDDSEALNCTHCAKVNINPSTITYVIPSLCSSSLSQCANITVVYVDSSSVIIAAIRLSSKYILFTYHRFRVMYRMLNDDYLQNSITQESRSSL